MAIQPILSPQSNQSSIPSKFIGTTNPGSPGMFIGMADSNLIDLAKKSSPDIITGLKDGTLTFTNDGEQQYLTDTKTGNVVQGVDLRQDMYGNLAVNVPTGNGGIIQFSTSVGDDGKLKPTDVNSAFNVGVNSSEGGFAGGLSNLTPAARAAALLYGGGQLVDFLAGAGAAGTAGTAGGAASSSALADQIAAEQLAAQQTAAATAGGALPAAGAGAGAGALDVLTAEDLAAGHAMTDNAIASQLAAATPLSETEALNLAAQSYAAGMTPEQIAAMGVGTGAGVGTYVTSGAAGLTAAQALAAAKTAKDLLSPSSSPGVASVPSGGTMGGFSSGPWNQQINPGIATIGKSNFSGFQDPLKDLMGNITPNYAPNQTALNNIMSHQYQGEFSPASGYAKGGKVEDKFEPEFIKMIKERSGGTPDHHHPNYNGSPLFRTGGSGKHVQGPGTGQSDDIPAMLADGEYVFDADTVSALGDGSNKAGAAALDVMREAIRKHKRSAPIDKIPPKAKNPLSYLKGK